MIIKKKPGECCALLWSWESMCVYVCFCFREERFFRFEEKLQENDLELKSYKKQMSLLWWERGLENEEAKQKPTQT